MRVGIWFVALSVIVGCARQPKPAAPAPAPAKPLGAMAAPTTVDPRPCGMNPMRIAGDRVGAIRVGMAADSVKMLCRVVADTFELPEGERQRTLRVAIGRDTVRTWITDRGTVYNIHVKSPRFLTPDSIRVGTPLARLLAFPDLRAAYGEGAFFVMSNAPSICGLSFAIDFGANRPQFMRNPTRELLEPYANAAKVDWIHVRPCSH